MSDTLDIEEVIDRLSTEWLGKKGVVGISDEEKNGELCIVFLVNQQDIERDNYPSEVAGYKVVVRPSGKIVSY